MTKRKREQFQRYESLRLQLAELSRRFAESGKRFPLLNCCLLQADRSMGVEGWENWIEGQSSGGNEVWDVFPSTWTSDDWSLGELESLEGQASAFAARFWVDEGMADAAMAEFTRLADTGANILMALKLECDSHERFSEYATFSYQCPGYPGWLDSIRNTAELHRSGYINVDRRMWGTQNDSLSVIREMARSMAEAREALNRQQPVPIGMHSTQISPDIFNASATAIRLWLQGEMSEPIEKHIMYDFQPIKIRGVFSTDRALAVAGIESLNVPQKISPRKQKKSLGRPRFQHRSERFDRKVFEAYRSYGGGKGVYAHLSKEFGITDKEARQIVDKFKKQEYRSRI